MIRNFKNFVVKEETEAELKKRVMSNPTYKKMESLCNKYNYELRYASVHEYENGKKSLYIVIDNRERYQPEIRFYEDYFGKKAPRFEIQTSSWGSLGLDEYEKYLKYCNNAYNLVKELSKIDLYSLSVINETNF